MSKKTSILLLCILLKFLLQYNLISPEYDLQRDEYLHLDQVHHLAWGYFSVPPVTSWISSIIFFLGGSVFWIKFFPALFGALTILIVWKAIAELKGSLFAQTLGASCILFSVLLRLNTLYQPNSLDVLCWTTFYFFLIKYVNTEQPKWLVACAIVFALGFLNKYNIGFLIIGLLPALLITQQRKVFNNKAVYYAALLVLILILPNLLWQYKNHFPVAHHLKELAETQLVNVDRWDFLKSQVFFFTGAIFVLVAALCALLLYKPFKQYQFMIWSLVFTLAAFLYFRAKDYYAIGIYPIYIAFGAVYLERLVQGSWKNYLQPLAIVVPLLFFVPMYQVVFPNRSPEYIVNHQQQYKRLGLLRWEDGKDHQLPQDFADMLGWKELAAKVDKAYANLPDPANTIVLCDNYGQAGAINYYTKMNIKAVSFNADYVNWFDFKPQYRCLIRVITARERVEEFRETASYFTYSNVADSVANQYSREYKTTIFIFSGPKFDLNKRLEAEVENVRQFK
jgi:hypothetical protein